MGKRMNSLKNKKVIVTGGSRGLGRSIVEALHAEGAQVWAIARDASKLDALRDEVKGVQTRVADVSDPAVAVEAMHSIRPDILILNAGVASKPGPIQQMTWEQFGATWNTDVKATFHFGREALLMPMAPGSVVVVVSSGAATLPAGSPLAGSFAGAKRTQWLLAQYMQQQSTALNLSIRFVSLLPKQIVWETDMGRAAINAFAAAQGISREAFMERSGPPLIPEAVGRSVVTLLTQQDYQAAASFSVSGRDGLAVLP
jgi:NAD(P)-dependent dehydrogenase (short-subunit alcohol dehydrogenase family)